MKLGQQTKTVLFGANSEIGNSLLNATGMGAGYPRVFFGRTVAGDQFRPNDIFIKFDAQNLTLTQNSFQQVVNNFDIDCAIISFASMNYSNLDQIGKSNFTNFNASTHLLEVLVEYFIKREIETKRTGTIIFISSSIVDLKPRQKNFRYAASKVASEYYFLGLRDQMKYSGYKSKMILIKPGFTKTKLHEREKPGPFATTVETLARSIDRSLKLNIKTIYAPMSIKIPIFLLSKLPTAFLNFLDRL
jgi:short-subunit dehydrogenase